MFNQVINAGAVRQEELDGTEYAVAPINLLKPMYLNAPGDWDVNEAYLPEQEAKKSLQSWNGAPLTLNHPTTNGVATTANHPEMVEKAVLGRVYNAGWDNGKATAEAWFNVEKIRDMGGMAENALERVLNGDTVEVSTGYQAERMPSGEYDGESHNAVQGNLKPDHVAVLPNKQGKCSVEAGCGVGESVAANMIVTNADPTAENYLSEARTPEYDGTETQSWADVSKTLEDWADALDIDADTVADMSESDRQEVAAHTLLGDPDADSWGELRFFPVVNPNTGNLNRGALEAVISGRGETQESVPESAEDSAQERARSLLEEEFDMSENSLRERAINALQELAHRGGADPAEPGRTEETTMSDKTQELVDNHGFDAENLPDEETDCFDAIYNRFTEEEEEEQPDEETATNDAAVTFESEEAFEQKVAEIVENRQNRSEKEQLASEIAANDDSYDDAEEVLEDYPTEPALNTKRADVLGGGPDFGASRGASPTPATNDADDAEDLKMFGGDA